MKRYLLTLLLITSFVVSCTPGVNTVQAYIEGNINKWGRFNVTVVGIKKIDGESYKNERTGQSMYAFEFAATVQANQEGYVLVREDGKVRNLTIFDHEPKDALNFPGLLIKEIRHVQQGDNFEVHNKVILEKHESDWIPIDLRWDLY
jgi:hypothetical protein